MNEKIETKAEKAKKQFLKAKLVAGSVGSLLVAIGIWGKKWFAKKDTKEQKKSYSKRK